MNIVKAKLIHLDKVTDLFDAYRQFYQQTSDVENAKEFIRKRLEQQDSQILLALEDSEKALGFTQLFPSFSSVSMKPVWILNDLYVAGFARQRGVAEALLSAAQDLAKSTGAISIKLVTATNNLAAQSLYIKNGYSKVVTFEQYSRGVE